MRKKLETRKIGDFQGENKVKKKKCGEGGGEDTSLNLPLVQF